MKLLHQVYIPSSKEDFMVLYPDKSRGFFFPSSLYLYHAG